MAAKTIKQPKRPELPYWLVKNGIVIAAFSEKDFALDIRNALLEQGIKTTITEIGVSRIVRPELN